MEVIMDERRLRAAINQANENEKNSNTFAFQVLIAAIALGILTSSWWVFGISLVALFICAYIRPLAIIMAVVFSLGWGGIGVGIGSLFESIPAMIVLGLIGFGIGLGVNLSGVQWFSDEADEVKEEFQYYRDLQDAVDRQNEERKK